MENGDINSSQSGNNFFRHIENNHDYVSLIMLIYSDGNLISDYKNYIIGRQKKFNYVIRYSELNYEEYINAYKEFMQIVADVVKEIGLTDNSISYSYVISNLINSGFLSHNLKFVRTSDKNDFFDIVSYEGIDIINGYGCCRHAVDIHKRIFDNLNMQSDKICCLAVSENSTSLSQSFKLPGNHIVNLIKYNNRYYLFDPFNNYIFYFQDCFSTNQYSVGDDIDRFTLFYKPIQDIILNNLQFFELNSRMEQFDIDSTLDHISLKELNGIIDETIYRYYSKKKILADLASTCKTYGKRIVPRSKPHIL